MLFRSLRQDETFGLVKIENKLFKVQFFKDNNYVNISFTNDRRLLIKNNNKICSTVHSVQGKTIEGNYSIHELRRMSHEVVYTAISRCRSIDNINIIPDNYKELEKYYNSNTYKMDTRLRYIRMTLLLEQAYEEAIKKNNQKSKYSNDELKNIMRFL